MTASRELRSRAEDAIRLTRRDVSALPSQDVQRLVYELQVHQIEIEMQNESLRSAQRDLEKSSDQYQELFDCAPAAYLMIDAAGAIVRANAAAVTLLGESATRLIGRRLATFVSNEDCVQLHEHVRSAQWNTRAMCELRLRPVNGVHVHVRLDTSTMPSLAADCLIVLTDISDRKRSVEALERLNAELEARVAARTAELDSRNRQLEAEISARARSETHRQALETKLHEVQRLESLGTLAAGIAHDFNNLLVSVLGNSDLLLLSPEVPSHFLAPLTDIKHSGRRAADLTRQLLMFAGRGQRITASISLPLVIADALASVRDRVAGRIQLQTLISAEVPPIEADRGQLHQVIMNLLTNAIEAIDGAGAIMIQTRIERLDAGALAEFQCPSNAAPGHYAILRVQDSGPGIAPEILARVFDPFFTTKFPGRGLGLAAVLGIVNSHHGAIRVEMPAGGGTRFEVAFPVASVEMVRHDSDHPPRLVEAEPRSEGSVLLIDDDDSVRGVMMKLLSVLGFDVTAANSGEDGLELYQQAGDAPFDLVVVDWQMPGLSGEEVLTRLRALTPELPMILISGYSAKDLAMDDARVTRLQKPMTLSQLRSAIRTVTAGADVARPRVSRGQQ